ncbi:MAG: helix-turn-helix domain-containing protein [Pseudomonadota bacterium]
MTYEPAFADQARRLCRLGATDEELAEYFGVCVRTIYRWRNTHEAFARAVTVGKEHADRRVKRALYAHACGCTVERVTIFNRAVGPGPVSARYTVDLPPDSRAALQWLRVRRPGKWREVEEDGGDPDIIAAIEKALARVADHAPIPVPIPAPPPPPGPPPGEEAPAPAAPAPAPAPDTIAAQPQAPRRG